jgi:hypothetical protein
VAALWGDIARVANALINSPETAEQDESVNHFLGAVVLKLAGWKINLLSKIAQSISIKTWQGSG